MIEHETEGGKANSASQEESRNSILSLPIFPLPPPSFYSFGSALSLTGYESDFLVIRRAASSSSSFPISFSVLHLL